MTKPDADLRFSVMAVQYAEGVRDGTIPACRWIRLACQRFLDDLSWQDDDTFDFIYDAEAAERACGFMEKMPHIKGRWAAKGLRLKLEQWQAFLWCNAFGWKRKADGLRRFRRVLLIVPRKNAKSTMASAAGIYMFCADGEHGAEVYSGATTEKQAWEVFGPARLMCRKSPALCDRFGIEVNARNINIVKNASKFEPIIGDPGDGASPTLGIIDEYHEHKNDKQFDTIETGMGAREQPMMLVITTAGDNIAGPCYALQERAQSMLEGTRPSDDLFALIYTVDPEDDWQDEAALRKANPNFDVSVSGEFLRTRQTEAMVSPRKQAIFKTKHLNIWVQSREAYFDVQRFQKAADPKMKPEDFADWDARLAIDLAEKRDLTALELVFREPVEDGARYARFGWYFCPEETIDLPENEHLAEWRDQGLLIGTPGAVTDDRVVREYAEDLMQKFGIIEIVFDPWHSRQMAVELSEAGATCVDFANSPSNMNEPMRQMDALITEGKLLHDGGKPFAWMLGNVVNGARRGSHDLHRPDKEKPNNKIDGPVGCIMAIGRFLKDDAPKPLEIGADYDA